MKAFFKLLMYSVIIVGLFFLLLIILSKKNSDEKKKPEYYRNCEINEAITMNEPNWDYDIDTKIKYNTIEESIDEYFKIVDISPGEYTVKIFERTINTSNGNYRLFLFAELKRNSDTPRLRGLLCREDANLLSMPLTHWNTGFTEPWFPTNVLNDEELTSVFLIQSLTQVELSEYTKDSNLFYGYGKNEQMLHLSIMGYSPTEVIPFQLNDETYYFWYYDYPVPFAEIIYENIDFRAFTLNECSKYFKISFDEENVMYEK